MSHVRTKPETPTGQSNQLFSRALQTYNDGDIDAALTICEDILSCRPGHNNALKLKGQILFKLQNYEQASIAFQTVLKYTPHDAETCNILGETYRHMYQLENAVQMFNQVIKLEPDNLGIYLKLATTQILAGRHEDAKQTYISATTLSGQDISPFFGFAQLCISRRELEHADIAVQTGLGIAPDNLALLQQKANILTMQGQFNQAEPVYRYILTQEEGNTDALSNLALCLENNNRLNEAKKLYHRCLTIDPEFEAAHTNLARIHAYDLEVDIAVKHCNAVLSRDPNHIKALCNLSLAYTEAKYYQDAIDVCNRIISLEPENFIGHYNLGNALFHLGDFNNAIVHTRKATQIDPTHRDAQFNLAMNYLSVGELELGWHYYFNRMRAPFPGDIYSPFIPGMDLSDKHVFLASAQGIGDNLFFLRFLPQFRALCKKVTFRCDPKIAPLLTHLPQIDNLITNERVPSDVDLSFSVDDLPLFLQANSIDNLPAPIKLYIRSDDRESVVAQLHTLPRPLIGLTWRAGTKPAPNNGKMPSVNKLQKEIELNQLTSLFAGFKGTLVILQRLPEKNEIDELENELDCSIIDLSSKNDNLPEMLALLDQIDDYVGVSNTNMHLLASIGKSAKVLIPNPPEWRWLQNNDKLVWMKGFTTFRQTMHNNWQQAISDLKNSLKQNWPAAYNTNLSDKDIQRND